jgi:hypothetical protein
MVYVPYIFINTYLFKHGKINDIPFIVQLRISNFNNTIKLIIVLPSNMWSGRIDYKLEL